MPPSKRPPPSTDKRPSSSDTANPESSPSELNGSPFGDLLRQVAAAPPHQPPQALPQPGTAITENVEIIRPLGQGGMGRVFLARDLALGRHVAVKFVLLDGDQQARRRRRELFQREARATARLSHPNIVTVHQYGEWQQTPYLVLERLRGETLRERLEAAPLGRLLADDVLDIARQVARGLAHAHRAGVVHRDLKPDNVFVQDDGLVRLLDFGLADFDPQIAAAQDAPSSVDGLGDLPTEPSPARAGTPLYMAPEQWRGEPQDARVDVWALGVIIYEMLRGAPPFTNMREVLAHDGALPRDQHLPELQPFTDLLAEMLRPLPAERPRDGAQIGEALATLTLQGERGSSHEEEQPYLFLDPFTEDDAKWFFGRSADVAGLSRRMKVRPFVALVGPSGAGKSSLVRAGLVPAFKREHPRATVLVMRPGARPLVALANRLHELLGEGGPDADTLLHEPGRCGEALRRHAALHQVPVLLCVDQLEEMLAAEAPARDQFAAAIASAADDPDGPVRVVVTVRDDHMARLVAIHALGELVAEGVFPLAAPGVHGLTAALVEPARRVGYTLDDTLVRRLTDELAHEDVPLPLLQVAASRLWALRDRAGRRLEAEHLERLGGIHGILVDHAEEVLAGVADEDLETARTLLCALVGANGKRRGRSTVELLALVDAQRGTSVLTQLIAGRILSTSSTQRNAVEIAHEAVVEQWGRLQTWLEENQAQKKLCEQLEQAAEAWNEQGRPRGMLWSGATLSLAMSWGEPLEARLTTAARSFLRTASRRQRRVQRVRLFVMSALVLLAAVTAVISYGVTLAVRESQEESRAARDRAETLVAYMSVELHERLSQLGRLDVMGDVVEAVERYYASLGDGLNEQQRARKVRALVQLADVRRDQGELQQARALYLASLAQSNDARISLQSDEAIDGRWAGIAADAHHGLGQVAMSYGALEESREHHERAHLLRLQRASRAPLDPGVARDLTRSQLALGSVHEALGEFDQALLAYQSARATRDQHARAGDATPAMQHDAAVVDLRIGDVQRGRGQPELALEAYRDAHARLRDVVSLDPANASWRESFGLADVKVGEALEDKAQLADAIASYARAREAFSRLLELDPSHHRWRIAMAMTVVKSARVEMALGLTKDALRDANEALTVLQLHAGATGEDVDWQRALAAAHLQQGEVLLELGQSAAAHIALETAVHAYRALVLRDPRDTSWAKGLAQSTLAFGSVLRIEGDLRAALQTFEESVSSARTLRDADARNPAWLRLLSQGLQRLGSVQRRLGMLTEATATYLLAREVLRDVTEARPDDVRMLRQRAIVSIVLGDLYVSNGAYDAASGELSESIAMLEKVAARAPDVPRFQRDLAMAFAKRGDLERADERPQGALAAFQRSLDIMQTLVTEDPENLDWQRDLSVAIDRLGDAYVGVGEPERALRAYEDSLAIASALAAGDPTNTELQRDLSVSLDKIGDAHHAAGRSTAAAQAYLSSITIMRELVTRDPVNLTWRRDLALSHERLGNAHRQAGDGLAESVARVAALEGLLATSRHADDTALDTGLSTDLARAAAQLVATYASGGTPVPESSMALLAEAARVAAQARGRSAELDAYLDALRAAAILP